MTAGAPAFGRRFIAVAAWATIIIPVGVDGLLFARAHIANPLWLPHAKLHCAMSFHAAVALGVAALLLLRQGDRIERGSLLVAALCATSFWIGLVAAGLWPETSYSFQGDAANYIQPPRLLGVPFNLNVVTAVLVTILGWVGWWLATRSTGSAFSAAPR